MVEEKIDAEVLKNLEEDMNGKIAEIAEVAKKLREQSMKLPEELKKIGDIKGLKMVADVIKELEEEAKEKKEKIETVLRDIQKNMGSLKGLKEKVKTEDITEEVKSILAIINEKQGYLKEVIKDIEVLKDKYTKKFFG